MLYVLLLTTFTFREEENTPPSHFYPPSYIDPQLKLYVVGTSVRLDEQWKMSYALECDKLLVN